MIFTDTRIPGVSVIDCDVFTDFRGFFARAWLSDEFIARGMCTKLWQCDLAFNFKRGTLRGMHYQVAPYEETKVVRVIRGAVFDVAIDLRPRSPTFKQWVGVELTADNRRSVYIPGGFAHGYQTLTDNTELMYFISERYSPPHERGVRWNDPAFGIEWPHPTPSAIHPRDSSYPDFDQ